MTPRDALTKAAEIAKKYAYNEEDAEKVEILILALRDSLPEEGKSANAFITEAEIDAAIKMVCGKYRMLDSYTYEDLHAVIEAVIAGHAPLPSPAAQGAGKEAERISYRIGYVDGNRGDSPQVPLTDGEKATLRAGAKVPEGWAEALVRYNDNARSFFQIANRIATELGTHALQTNFGAFADMTERMLKDTHAITNEARDMLAAAPAQPSSPSGNSREGGGND